MVVVLDESEYDAWLDSPQNRMREFLARYPAEQLESEPAPRPTVPKSGSAAAKRSA